MSDITIPVVTVLHILGLVTININGLAGSRDADARKEYLKEYWNGNQQGGETEEDQGKDGLWTSKKIYR